MPRHIADALRRVPVLARTRRRRLRKPRVMPAGTPRDPQPSLARMPCVLTMSSRRWRRETMPEAVVPYLRMSGRWLEEHGFVIGTTVQVLVEYGRVTLISEIYDIARGLARDPNSATVASLVANMKRDYGRRGRPKGSIAIRKAGPPAPGIGVPTPRLLPGNEPEGWPGDDADPRG